jgi:3-phenylpropionate/trans-cinnamate dioxygenase ferredoxin component
VTSGRSGYHRAAALADVPDGTMVSVQLETGERVCLFNFRGEIGAVSDTCPHQEFPMCDGTLLEDGTIECAWHGARFDRVTGDVRRHPATEPLPVFEVRVSDGHVFVGPRKMT